MATPIKITYMTVRLTTIIFIICLLSYSVFSQSVAKVIESSNALYEQKEYDKAIDLLKSKLKPNEDISELEEIDIRLLLAKNYVHSWKTTKASNEYKKAWQLSRKIENDSLSILSGNSLVSIMGFLERSDSTKYYIDQILEYDSMHYSDRSNLYLQLAGFYEDKHKIDSAIYYGELAANIDSIHQDSSSIPYTFYDLGNFYVSNFNYSKGIAKILYGLDYIRDHEQYKRTSIETALSNIYLRIGNIHKAKELAMKTVTVSKNNDRHINLTNAYNALGNCAAYQDNYAEALRYYMLSDSVNSSKSNNFWRGMRAKISIIEQKLNLNIPISDSEMSYVNNIDKNGITQLSTNKIEFVQLRLGNYTKPEFEKEYQRIYKSSNAENVLSLQLSLLKIKKEYLTKKRDYAEALDLVSQINKINKKITQNNNEYIIQDLEVKYRKKEQELKINYLDKEIETSKTILAAQKNKIVYGSIALALITILSFFLLRLYNKTKYQKEIISKALSEKDLLLREIHHRVKNNLQLVSSLLTMQGRSIDDETAMQAINEGKSRVRSMALIHQDLYNKENLMGISVKTYIEKLSSELFETYKIDDNDIHLQLEIADIQLDVDTLVPFGLIINELITNSLKYAFKENKSGQLSIKMIEDDDDTIKLRIKDNGIGYNPTEVRENSFGATLVTALVSQLEGDIQIDTTDGTDITITIKANI